MQLRNIKKLAISKIRNDAENVSSTNLVVLTTEWTKELQVFLRFLASIAVD